MERQTIRGNWWLPGEYQERVGGILTYEPESDIKLELFETFRGMFDPSDVRTHRLNGISVDGDRICLYGCHRESYSFSSGSTSSRYSAKTLVVTNNGDLFNNSAAFDKVYISFPLLERWLRYTPRPTFANFRANSPGDEISMTAKVPETIHIRRYDPKLRLRARPRQKTDTGSGSISITPEFVISFRRPRVSLSEYKRPIRILSNLIAFSTGEPVRPSYLRGTTPSKTEEDSTQFSDIYYPYPKSSDINSKKNPSKFLIKPNEFSEGYSKLINKWFEVYTKLEPMLDMYFSTHYTQSMNIQTRFLSLCQCIEGYYIRKTDSESLTEKEWDDALAELARQHDDVLYDINFRPTQRLEEIRDTRHHYLHQALEKGQNVAEEEDIMILSWSLQQLIDAAILKELSVNDDKIRDNLSKRYTGRVVV